MDVSIDAITNNIQLALAPVFLLTAVATLINAISGRLARSVDRMRAIRHSINLGEVKDVAILRHMNKEADEAQIRGRLCTAAIFFDVLSGVFISLTVLELFFFQAGAVRSLQTSYVIWTFVRTKQKGLLILYPLLNMESSPSKSAEPIMGFAISFPRSDTAKEISYTVNNVFDKYGDLGD